MSVCILIIIVCKKKLFFLWQITPIYPVCTLVIVNDTCCNYGNLILRSVESILGFKAKAWKSV